MAKTTERIQTVEEWVLDPTKYKDGLKSLAAGIRENNRVARDAAVVQAELAKQFDETEKKSVGWIARASSVKQTYVDLSQKVRDAIQIGKKFNKWLAESSPEWKRFNDDIGASTKVLGAQIAQAELLQNVMRAVGSSMDTAAVAVAAFTGKLRDLPASQLNRALLLTNEFLAGSTGVRPLSREQIEAMTQPFRDSPEEQLRGRGTMSRERTRKKPQRKAGGGGGGLGSVSWDNQGVLSAGESVIAGEVKEAARQEAIRKNLPLIDAAIQADQRWAETLRDQANALMDAVRAQEAHAAAARYDAEAIAAVQSPTQIAVSAAEQLGGVLDGVTENLWNAADAAMQSGASWGKVVLQIVKAELLGVATRATIKALEATALGFLNLGYMNFPAAGSAFTSAGMWTALAAAAGAGGLAIGAATRSSSGGGSSRTHWYTDRSVGSFSDRKSEKEKEINVYVYLGDKYDRSAQLYMRRAAEAVAA